MINPIEKFNNAEYVTKEGKEEGIKVHNKPAVILEDTKHANISRSHTCLTPKIRNVRYTQENWRSQVGGCPVESHRRGNPGIMEIEQNVFSTEENF